MVNHHFISERVLVVVARVDGEPHIVERNSFPFAVDTATAAIAAHIVFERLFHIEDQTSVYRNAVDLDLLVGLGRSLGLLHHEAFGADPLPVVLQPVGRRSADDLHAVVELDDILVVSGGAIASRQTVFGMLGTDGVFERQLVGTLLHLVAAGLDDMVLMRSVAEEFERRGIRQAQKLIRVVPLLEVVETENGDQVVQPLVLDRDRHLAKRRRDVHRRFAHDVEAAVPHAFDAFARGFGDDVVAGRGQQFPAVGRNEVPGGEFRTDFVKAQRARLAVERDRAADMERTVALENLPGEGTQAQLQHVAVRRFVVDTVKAIHIDINLPERRARLDHALGVQIHPVRDVELQFQQVEAHLQQRPQTPPACDMRPVEVREGDARKQVEPVDGLDRHFIRRRGEALRVEVGHDVATPIERPVAHDRHAEAARVRGEQADILEIFGTEDIDRSFRCLDRHEEFVTAALPGYFEGLAAFEAHLFGRTGIVPLGYLHPPERTLELALQFRIIP